MWPQRPGSHKLRPSLVLQCHRGDCAAGSHRGAEAGSRGGATGTEDGCEGATQACSRLGLASPRSQAFALAPHLRRFGCCSSLCPHGYFANWATRCTQNRRSAFETASAREFFWDVLPSVPRRSSSPYSISSERRIISFGWVREGSNRLMPCFVFVWETSDSHFTYVQVVFFSL